MSALRSKSDAVKKPFSRQFLLVILSLVFSGVFATSMGGCVNKPYPDPPATLIDDSVEKTVKAAADNGWMPCPGECLKLSQPGWQHKHIEGFADSDIWMAYPYTDANGPSWQAYSQRHIGHIIRAYPNKAAEDTGNCPVCNGTGWVRKK